LKYRKSGRSHWWRRRGAKPICERPRIKKVLEEYLASDSPMPPLRWTVLPQVSAMRSIAPSGRSARSCAALSGKIEGQRRARVAAIEPTLEQALQESPPPSLRQVTKRLGFSATCVLKAHAPDLYERLKTHWQAYARIRRTELQNKLKAVLQEKPPPSLRSVYSRQGVTESIVNTSFPDLRRGNWIATSAISAAAGPGA